MQAILLTFKPIYEPLGQDIFCFSKKFLVFNFVGRNLKIKYRRSIFGLFWTLLSPLAMSAVYYFVFKIVLKIQIPHHLVFIMSGILTWSCVSQSIMESMESIVGNIGLISKVPVPPQIFPFVGTVTNFITYLLATPILLGASWVSGVPIGASLLALPFFIISLFLQTYSMSLVLALLFVRLRDLRHLMGILLQIWFYATPIIYHESMIPPKYSWVLKLNPLGGVFSGLHAIWSNGTWPSVESFWTTGAWSFGCVLIAAWIYKAYYKGLVEQI